MLRMRNRNDVYAGLFLIGVAIVFIWQGWGLYVGTLDEMGPGYFPNLLSVLQILLGSAVFAGGFSKAGELPEAFRPRPLILVLASIGFFCLTIEHLGLFLSLFGVVMIAGLAQQRAQHVHNVILAIALAFFSALIFVKGLSLQMTIWPAGLLQP
ncbi:membrane protein [Betaproteobacteria bacterium]|nr:membrane protein [Betaproteobacteria bacterium]